MLGDQDSGAAVNSFSRDTRKNHPFWHCAHRPAWRTLELRLEPPDLCRRVAVCFVTRLPTGSRPARLLFFVRFAGVSEGAMFEEESGDIRGTSGSENRLYDDQ